MRAVHWVSRVPATKLCAYVFLQHIRRPWPQSQACFIRQLGGSTFIEPMYAKLVNCIRQAAANHLVMGQVGEMGDVVWEAEFCRLCCLFSLQRGRGSVFRWPGRAPCRLLSTAGRTGPIPDWVGAPALLLQPAWDSKATHPSGEPAASPEKGPHPQESQQAVWTHKKEPHCLINAPGRGSHYDDSAEMCFCCIYRMYFKQVFVRKSCSRRWGVAWFAPLFPSPSFPPSAFHIAGLMLCI